jgi:RNA polymerase sigma factor (sigma-70 family)
VASELANRLWWLNRRALLFAARSRNLSGLLFLWLLIGEMRTSDSRRLIADYVKTGSELAFRELLTRYIDLVYSTALRRVCGDAHMAQDVTQTVFAALARKARTLGEDVMLGGWLHHHTVYVASTMMRTQRRRQYRESQAVEMNAQQDHSEANLAQLTPVLDEAIDQLGAEERTAILLRFFEQLDFRSVGEALGSTEEAARKRVTRALEKLRSTLHRRGVTLSTAALGTVLATEAVTAAPAGLAASVFSAAALAGVTALEQTSFMGAKLMAMTKVKLGIIGAIAIATITTPWVLERQAQAMSRQKDALLRQNAAQLELLMTENQRLSEQLARERRLMQANAASFGSAAANLPSGTLYDRLKDKWPKLTSQQAEGAPAGVVNGSKWARDLTSSCLF